MSILQRADSVSRERARKRLVRQEGENKMNIREVGWSRSWKKALDIAHECRVLNPENRYKIVYKVIEVTV